MTILTKISRRGYSIPIGHDSVPAHIKALTATPETNFDPGFPLKPKPIKVYRKSERSLIMPRYYGLQNFGKETINTINLPDRNPIPMDFRGKLRQYQDEVVQKSLSALHDPLQKGGILSLATGLGKTVIALNIITQLKTKTLIVVNKEVLLNQWKEQIKLFIPDCSVGIIRQNNVEVENNDIVVAMLQSLSKKDYSPHLFDPFGLLVVDEVHNICSRTFSKALFKVQPEFRIGLSATPTRKDGMSKILHWHLGPIIQQMDKPPGAEIPDDPTIEFITIPQNSKTEIFNNFGKVNGPAMINQLVEDKERNVKIVEKINELKKKGRTIIVFTDRRNHCTLLKKLRYRLPN